MLAFGVLHISVCGCVLLCSFGLHTLPLAHSPLPPSYAKGQKQHVCAEGKVSHFSPAVRGSRAGSPRLAAPFTPTPNTVGGQPTPPSTSGEFPPQKTNTYVHRKCQPTYSLSLDGSPPLHTLPLPHISSCSPSPRPPVPRPDTPPCSSRSGWCLQVELAPSEIQDLRGKLQTSDAQVTELQAALDAASKERHELELTIVRLQQDLESKELVQSRSPA